MSWPCCVAATRSPSASSSPGWRQPGVVVARFLAVLELYRHSAIGFEQLEPLGELTLRWAAETWSDDEPREPGGRL